MFDVDQPLGGQLLNANSDVLPKVNDVIVSDKTKKKYKLIRAIGSGGYGVVFEVESDANHLKLALKAEKYSKSMLHVEASVLKSATQHNCTRIVHFVEYGHSKPHYCYLVMPLLGKDLCTLRNEQKSRFFSQSTAVRVGIQTLQAIQELHGIGFISRDIKPGNYALGRNSHERTIFLIDFGLARKYMDANNNIIPPRKDIGWRGTTRYGSLQAHLKQDLNRKDDSESWMYMLVECTKGSLPWRMVTDRNLVQVAKINCRTITRSSFFDKCPAQYSDILSHIDTLSFADAPKYELMIGLLEAAMKQNQIEWSHKYDWENSMPFSTAIQSSSANDGTKRAQMSE